MLRIDFRKFMVTRYNGEHSIVILCYIEWLAPGIEMDLQLIEVRTFSLPRSHTVLY
jgi:hypothetical protein